MNDHQNGGRNGYSGEQINGYLKQIEKHDDELATLRGEYMSACKGPRAAIKNVLAIVREAGVNMTAFRQIVEDDRAERKRLKHVDALEPDDAEVYAAMVEALGPFGETELGSAALRKAKPAGDETLANLGRADESALGGVGRGEGRAMLVPRCPHCRQVITSERCGVLMSPLKAAIFDAIKRAGNLGISGDEIAHSDIYRDRRRASRHTIKAHVWQINSLLASTNLVIVSDRRRWFLKQYDPTADFAGSINECYRAIRKRKANGGPEWTPK